MKCKYFYCTIWYFQLETKVAHLEKQLVQSLEEKQRLQEEFQLLKNVSQKSQSSKYSDPTATIEQLSEVFVNLNQIEIFS